MRLRNRTVQIWRSQNSHGESHLDVDLVFLAYIADLTVPQLRRGKIGAKTRHKPSVRPRHVNIQIRPYSVFIWPRAWASHQPTLLACEQGCKPMSIVSCAFLDVLRPCSIPLGWCAFFFDISTAHGCFESLFFRGPACSGNIRREIGS